MAHALIVDDDQSFTAALAEYVGQYGFSVNIAGTLEQARAQLNGEPTDLLVVDVLLPDGSGLELIREMPPEAATKVLVITGHPTVDSAIEALRARVYDYIPKPLDIKQLRECLAQMRSQAEVQPGEAQAQCVDDAGGQFGPLLGASASMRELYRMIAKVAPSEATVLLQGESGTGKELVAQTIHELSDRRKGSYLALNCGAISASLIGSEIFGHERGSFTGASQRHRGYFERASGGTLFLDEITEMPMDLQVHLLRVLETGSLVRLGGDQEIEVDVRLIAATNRRPEEAIAEGKLREDLYFRLSVFPIALPPLREREGDVELLAMHFLDILNEDTGSHKRFTPAALDCLSRHAWPGNVRELKNTIQRAFILADEEIDAHHLITRAEHFPGGNQNTLNIGIGTSIEDIERHLILATLEHFKGNKKLAAETLGVSLKTLYNRLKQYQEQ